MTLDKIEVRRQVEELDELPPFPEVAEKVLALRAQSRPNVSALATIIELDPSLSAQVIRYARSSLYGYRGNVNSVDNAISRVLGYDMVLNLALGLAASRPFTIPAQGPLGVEAYWNHAIRTAVFAQRIAEAIPDRNRIVPGMTYLAGLLHEFGLLVVGHLFPDAFEALNNALDQNPDVNLVRREYELLGVTHGEAGARTLRFWDLPDELVVTALKHRDPHYSGLYEDYPHLIYVANTLLYAPPSRYAESVALLAQQHPWFQALGIPPDTLLTLAEETTNSSEDINAMVRKIAA